MRCHMLVLLMALLLAAATPSLVSGQEVGEVLLNLTTPRSPATGGLSGKVALPETLIFEEAIAVDEPEEGEDDYQETTLFINKMLPNVNVTYTAPGDDGGDVALTTLFVNYTFVPGTAGR